MNQLWTALSSTTISGYVNTSINWNTGTGNGSVPTFAFNTPTKQDGFNLDVVKIAIAKPLDESQWSAGYNVELIYGDDARTLGTTLDSGGDSSAAAIKQAYVALRAPVGNGLDFKVGVFDTIIGYEVFDAGNNPNYTRSYGYSIEPTTHTGVLMSYQVNKSVSLTAGIANTFGPVINARANGAQIPGPGNQPMAESSKTYMASAALTAPDDWGFIAGSTLYFGVINGFNSGLPGTQTSWYVGATVNTPVKNLKVGASFDYLGTSDNASYDVTGTASHYANAWALYTSFQATEKLSLHLRGEYASTDTGLLGTAPGTIEPGGNSEIFALTGTIQYDLWKNVLSRLEVRWDHQAGDDDMTGYGGELGTVASGTGVAGVTGDKRNNVMIVGNIIFKF
jgi:hypothetical protein